MSNETKDQQEKLLQLIREAVQQDQDLREKYQLGGKFRFISDRLNALVGHVEENISLLKKETIKSQDEPTEDETFVYIYLYNAQGLVFKTWQKMLSPSVFYEYSVNRPIYTDKAFVEAFIRSKQNKVQHGFLTVIIKKIDILKTPQGLEPPKDQIGNPLIKVREGTLLFKRLVSFTHNGHEYIVNEEGEIVKKTQL
jgi:intracellular multiplication protein IcmQ